MPDRLAMISMASLCSCVSAHRSPGSCSALLEAQGGTARAGQRQAGDVAVGGGHRSNGDSGNNNAAGREIVLLQGVEKDTYRS